MKESDDAFIIELSTGEADRTSLREIKRGRVDPCTGSLERILVIGVALGHSCPTWLFSNRIMNWVDVRAIVCAEDLMEVIAIMVPSTTLILSGRKMESLTLPDHLCDAMTLGIVSGSINNTIIGVLRSAGVIEFLTSVCPRRLHASWKKHHLSVSHARYGGVTDHVQSFWLCSIYNISLGDVSGEQEERDAFTIVDDSIWCNRKRRSPNPKAIRPLKVVNVGTEKSPIFHIGGLLPHDLLSRIFVTTPGIGLPKLSWGVRKLSMGEKLDALDVDQELIPKGKLTLCGSLLAERCPLTSIPCKSWIIALQSLCRVTSGVVSMNDCKRQKSSKLGRIVLGIDSSVVLQTISNKMASQKASKADNAGVDVSMWLIHFLNGGVCFGEICLPSRVR